MKTAIQQAIDSIKDYRNLGTADFDTCNTILLHLASLLEKEKEQIIKAYQQGVTDEYSDTLDFSNDTDAEEYYNETFNTKE